MTENNQVKIQKNWLVIKWSVCKTHFSLSRNYGLSLLFQSILNQTAAWQLVQKHILLSTLNEQKTELGQVHQTVELGFLENEHKWTSPIK